MFNVIIEFSVFLILLSVPIENTRQVNARSRQERGKPLPLDYYVTDGSDNSSHTNSTVGTVLRHPYSDLHCIC